MATGGLSSPKLTASCNLHNPNRFGLCRELLLKGAHTLPQDAKETKVLSFSSEILIFHIPETKDIVFFIQNVDFS